MNISNISFPYPVLGLRGDESSDDADVMGDFRAPCELAIDEFLEVKAHFKLHSRQLEELILNGLAVFACEVMCSKTAFRCVYTARDPQLVFKIDTNLLRDQVVLHFYIIAQRVFDYSDAGGWHSDYKGRTFTIPKGAVLAYGGEIKELIEREPAESTTGGSLIKVEPSNNKNGPFEIDMESDKLTIYVPSETFSLFEQLYKHNPSYASIFHSSLVVPALVESITAMRESPRDYQDKKWYQAIDTKISNDHKLKKHDIASGHALTIAQCLMDFPFSEVTSSLARNASSESEE